VLIFKSKAMLRQYRNTIKKSLLMLAVATGFSACVNKDEFFELPDRGGIDAAIFSTEGALEMHLNRAYDVIIPQFLFQDHNSNNMQGRYGIHFASDENFLPSTDQWARTALGLQNNLTNHDVRFTGNTTNGNAGGNKYMDIARCNNAIKFIPEGTLPKNVQNRFLGQYYALRAMVYFELVKVYGGVPLVLEPQDPENINISGRASAKECFDVIIRDLDSATVKLQGVTWSDGTGRGRIDQLIATCLKAKVLMYWASPQFNPTNDPKHAYDASRWTKALEANKAAYDMCLAAGKKLLPNYADIFRIEGTSNTEAILVRTYSSSIERRGHDGEYRSRPTSEGGSPHSGYRATTKLLDAYTMKDGNSIGTSSAYSYDPVMFWVNRDPRFEATIAYNGSVWPLSGKTNRRQWTYNAAADESNINGVYCKRFALPNITAGNVRYQNNIGGNGMDWVELRLAEVMLNYAECANETGDLSVAKELVRTIRKRAGIEEGGAGNDYGLGAVSSPAQMRDLIMNERMVEFAFENKRNADLRRTRRMHLLTGNMETIEFLVKDDQAKTALEAPTGAAGARFRESLNLNDKNTFLQYFREPAIVRPSGNYLPYNVPEFHYFYTFHNDFVYRGVDIQPTIGWAGGTFDPLD